MELIKQQILEERVCKLYSVDGKSFTPEITYRNGIFHHFTLHIQTGFKTKYDLKLDAEDKEVFNCLKDFFKSIE